MDRRGNGVIRGVNKTWLLALANSSEVSAPSRGVWRAVRVPGGVHVARVFEVPFDTNLALRRAVSSG